MRIASAALMFSLALFGLNGRSDAAVVPVFNIDPAAISAGQQSTLDLQLNLTADSGYFNAQFTGGSVTLYSGYGPSESFAITPGGTLKDFTFSFSYPTVGTYLPSFYYSANYSQQYQQYQQVGTGQYWVNSGYYYTYSCGFFSTCGYWVDTSHWQYYPIYGYVTYTSNAFGTNSGAGLLSVDAPAQSASLATPLPGALPLFAGGFGMLALLGWRRGSRKRTGW
jgi:hypothetical protein